MAVVTIIALSPPTSAGPVRERADDAESVDDAGALGFATEEQVFSNDRSLIGRGVSLDDQRVRGKAGNGLWIGGRGRRVFVTIPDPSMLEALAVGARIDIRGELRAPLAARQAMLELATGARDARRLAASPFYIDAWSVTHAR